MTETLDQIVARLMALVDDCCGLHADTKFFEAALRTELSAPAVQGEQEAIYQVQTSVGTWIDQGKHSYEYNMRHRQATVRVLYTTPQPAEQKPENELVTPEMFDAGADAAREYFEIFGGNSPTVIYQAMRAVALKQNISRPAIAQSAQPIGGEVTDAEVELMLTFVSYKAGLQAFLNSRLAATSAKQTPPLQDAKDVATPPPVAGDARMLLIESLVASKGWNYGYAAAFVDDWFYARVAATASQKGAV